MRLTFSMYHMSQAIHQGFKCPRMMEGDKKLLHGVCKHNTKTKALRNFLRNRCARKFGKFSENFSWCGSCFSKENLSWCSSCFSTGNLSWCSSFLVQEMYLLNGYYFLIQTTFQSFPQSFSHLQSNNSFKNTKEV